MSRFRPTLSTTTLDIAADDDEGWKLWFQNAFKLLRQLACRDIAREWIRVIHPRKQATHPYNGRLLGNKELAPEVTKPPYWPMEVKHKEPDHISKEGRELLSSTGTLLISCFSERVKLLLHLLMNTPHHQMPSDGMRPKLIYAETLLLALEKIRGKLDKFQRDIIYQIAKARSKLEKISSLEHGQSRFTEILGNF